MNNKRKRKKKRFADNLAGRYNFIVKKTFLAFTCSVVPRTWNLEFGDIIKPHPWENLRWTFVSSRFIGENFGDCTY
jgi:hypothetical protein